jgi:selenium metabolism protein YedF
MKIVDTRGQSCPAPLIATKRALNETQAGESFIVMTDNQTSFNNLCRFLKDNNAGYSVSETGGVWNLTIISNAANVSKSAAEDFCTEEIPHFSRGNFIVAFSSDKMGQGDDQLGLLLMANFIKAIKDLDILPDKMIFYNKGVTLGSDESPASEHLTEIEKMGVKLYFCGTCLNHYSLEQKVKIGTVSNMFEIAQVMSSAGNIVKP